jgi:hypothetical protein
MGTIEDIAELHCPICVDDVNLHHFKLEVWNRERENALSGTHIIISDQNVEMDHNAEDGNPSFRRDGLKISFWCETCSGLFNLCLSQHKGTTYMKWEQLPGTAHEGLKS